MRVAIYITVSTYTDKRYLVVFSVFFFGSAVSFRNLPVILRYIVKLKGESMSFMLK